MDVLLVEDELSIRDLLCEDLVDAGLAVTPAGTAEEVLTAAFDGAQQPAVLVTDVNLGPGMDGLALVEEVRRRWPEVCVVVMTGEEANLPRISANVNCLCLLKPFDPPRLVREVNMLMGRSIG